MLEEASAFPYQQHCRVSDQPDQLAGYGDSFSAYPEAQSHAG